MAPGDTSGKDDDGSKSPRARARDPTAAAKGRELAVARPYAPVVAGPSNVPPLTRSNYAEWSLLMEVSFQARGLWPAIQGEEDLEDECGYRNDRSALELIYKSVPPEMLPVLRKHKSAHEVWDAIRKLRAGSEKVRDAKAQTLRTEYENLHHKPGESVDDLAMRLTGLTARLGELGDPISDKRVMQKWLRIAPKRFSQLACSIDSLVDLDTTSIEELVGRFKAAEERHEQEQEEGGTQLLLTEEEWRLRAGRGSPGGGSSGSKKPRGKQHDRSKDANRAGGNNNNAPRRDGNCRYCGKAGHWARECRKKQREEGAAAEAHVAEADDADPALLMALVLPQEGEALTDDDAIVHLNEERAKVCLGAEDDAKDPRWHMDTGASNHMTGNSTVFSELDRNVSGTVRFGDGSVVDIKGRGTVVFVSHQGRHRVLSRVYYIPRLQTSIISVGQLDEVGCSALVKGGFMVVRDRQEELIARVPRTGNRLYTIALQVTRPICLAASAGEEAWKWHARYGHLNFESLRKLGHDGMVHGMPMIEHVDEICDGCLVGKQRRASFPATAKYRADERLDLVHGDLCGPISPPTHGGKRYFLLLVDDKTRYMWLVLLRSKDEAPTAIRRWQAGVEVETRVKLRVLRTDRGGEFNSTEFGEYCADRGVRRHLTAPYSPQQNGVVERRNQTVVGTARCLLKSKGMPNEFWGEAVTTAVLLLNCAPTKSVQGTTPYESWHGEKPTVSYFRTFGCIAHAKVTKPNPKKLDDRSLRTVFIGYENGRSKAWRVYDPVAKRVHITRDAIFDEAARWDWGAEQLGGGTFVIDTDAAVAAGLGPIPQGHAHEATEPASPASPATPLAENPGTPAGPGSASPTSSTATAYKEQGAAHGYVSPPSGATPDSELVGEEAPRRYRTLESVYDDDIDVGGSDSLLFVSGEEPSTFAEAEPHAAWRAAMMDELASIEENGTWALTTLPAGKRPIGLKWVFKLKKDSSGVVVKHKARLVAKGHMQ
jgi:transposase InsO family protein